MEPNAAWGSSRTMVISIRREGRHEPRAAHPRAGVGQPSSADLVTPLFFMFVLLFYFPSYPFFSLFFFFLSIFFKMFRFEIFDQNLKSIQFLNFV
jgi:hypothetical protein